MIKRLDTPDNGRTTLADHTLVGERVGSGIGGDCRQDGDREGNEEGDVETSHWSRFLWGYV